MLASVAYEILVRWIEFAPVVVGLVLTSVELRRVQKAHRLSNHLQITENHRQIWSYLLDHPRIGRVLEKELDLDLEPVTNEESIFVTFLLLHLKTTFRAEEAKLLVPAKALSKDIRWFLSLPIPKFVWTRSKEFQDGDFLKFVERSVSDDARA